MNHRKKQFHHLGTSCYNHYLEQSLHDWPSCFHTNMFFRIVPRPESSQVCCTLICIWTGYCHLNVQAFFEGSELHHQYSMFHRDLKAFILENGKWVL